MIPAAGPATPAPVAARPSVRALVAPLLALAFGALHATAFAPWDRWWLQVLAQAALFVLLALRTGAPGVADAPPLRWRRAAALGFAFALGHFLTGVSWVYVSMHDYGGMPAALAGAATLAFCAYLALYPALALGAVHRWLPPSAATRLVAVPAAWTIGEGARGVVLTGFPWLASGYAHVDGPLAGFAPLLGVAGVTLAAALLAALVTALAGPVLRMVPPLRASRAALALLAAVALLAGGERLRALQWTSPVGPPLRVSLLQGNIPQDLKFVEGGLERSFTTYLQLARQGGPTDLVVMPESVLPVPLSMLPPELPEAFVAAARARGAALIFGAFREDPRDVYTNSAIAVPPQGSETLHYGKRHLVPFGEFIPPGFRWFVDLMEMPIGDQGRGPARQRTIPVGSASVAVNICYEDLFPRVIADAWRDTSAPPTVMLNLSNLAWFGNSLALPQHLQISRMRALETQVPMLRATNTGATAIIDGDGRVQGQLPFLTVGALDGTVQGRLGETPYVTLGDGPAGVLCALLLASAMLRGRRPSGAGGR